MATLRIRNFHAGVMLVTALAVSIWPAAGQAYTPEQEQACAKKSQLSPPCRAQFRPDPEPSRAAVAPAGKPMAISPATPRKSVSAKRKTRKPAKKPAST